MLKQGLKKAVICGAFFTCVISTAHAGLYIGPTLLVRDTISSNSTVRESGLRLSLGYGDFVAPSFYLAGEAFAIPGSILLKNNTSYGTSVRNTYSYGASLLPGIPVTDSVLGYLRLGVVETRFSSASVTAAGGQVGLGLQTGLTCDWDLRMEYTYTMYRSVSNAGTPKADWFGLGLTYKLSRLDQ